HLTSSWSGEELTQPSKSTKFATSVFDIYRSGSLENAMARLPLAGIRVTDFSWIINGPQIGQWLAAMGAEVIKIESQVYMDIGRINPSGMADRVQGYNRNGYYHALNYGKKAITLNLASEKGRGLADEIIRKS